VRLWELPDGQMKQLGTHGGSVYGVAFAADGQRLASAGADALVKLWNFTTGERLKNVEGFGKEVTSLGFVGITGEVLASCGDGQLRLIRDNGENVRGYTGANDYLYCAAATPDGKTVVAGGQDGILRIWSGDGKEMAAFPP